MKQFVTRFLTCLLTGFVVLSIAPSASADESQLDFRVSPATGSDVSEGGDYFVLPMAAGEADTQSVTVSNPSSQSLEIRLAAVDAATAQMGGVDYGSEEITPEATGTWIALEESQVRLAAGESAEVEFDVGVPSDAGSGVHLAGLVVWVEGDEDQAAEGASATMNVQARRVIAVQIELPGPAAPLLEVRGAEAEARPDGLYLGIDLFNSGTGFAKGTGTVSIEGRDAQETFTIDTIVPGTGTVFPFRWASASIPSGSYEVSIEVDYGGSAASWQGEVLVGSAVQSDLRGRGVGEGSGSGQQKYLVPGGILLLLAISGLLFRRMFSGRVVLRLPRVSFTRSPKPAVVSSLRSPQRNVMRSAPAAPPPVFLALPRSEELQRRVPPPPPPPPARLASPPPPPPSARRAGRAA